MCLPAWKFQAFSLVRSLYCHGGWRRHPAAGVRDKCSWGRTSSSSPCDLLHARVHVCCTAHTHDMGMHPQRRKVLATAAVIQNSQQRRDNNCTHVPCEGCASVTLLATHNFRGKSGRRRHASGRLGAVADICPA
eukprot:352020-Chlamydomonas_euryale.AAC.5